MTAPHLTRTLADEVAPSAATPDAVLTVSGGPRTLVTVAAVVVTQGRTPFLQTTLDALAAQDRVPDEVLVVDVDAAPSTGTHQELRLGERRFVGAAGARSLGEAVDRALRAVGATEATWLWILHDDSAPAPDALAHLLRAVEHSSAVAVAGCKQRRWLLDDDGEPVLPDPTRPGLLIEVGYWESPLGRRMTGIDDSEIDQGQHDAREDVLAVGLAGALVRRTVWTELGGTDPELGRFGDSLDLCRRARLAGHRVVVVADAVVHHAQASLRGLREGRATGTRSSQYARRRSQLYARLVGLPLPLVPVAMVAMLVWAPFAAAYRLALKRPAQARDELVAPFVTVLRLVPLVRGRRRAARTRTAPRSVLRPLRATWRQVATDRRDTRLTRSEAQRGQRGPTDLERSALARLARRRRTALGLVLLVVVGVAVAAFGSWQGVLADGGRVVGGALLPAPATFGEAAEAATSGWVRDALGTGAPADPLLVVLTALTGLVGGSVQTAVNLLVVAALPLAALGGWFAAGVVNRSVWARAGAALVWAASPVLLVSLQTGRLGAVVAHLVLPWVLVAVVRTVGVQARDAVGPPRPRRGSLGAAAAAGLLLAVAACAAPVLLPVAILVLGVWTCVAWRHWRRFLLVLVPAVVVALPFWWHLVAVWSEGGWRLALAEPGLPLPATPSDGVGLLLGHPTEPAPWFEGTVLAGSWSTVAPWVLGGLLLLLGAAGVFARRRALAAAAGLALGAVGLVAALVAAGTVVASGRTSAGDDAVVHGWPGAGLSLLVLGVGVAALVGVPRPGRRPARRVVVGAVAVVVLAVPLAGLGAWWFDEARTGTVGSLTATEDPVVPAVGQQMQAPPRAARVLELDRRDGAVEYTLLHADGSSLLDSSVVVRARDAGLVPGPERTDVAVLDELVAQLAVGRSPDLAARLTTLGVGAVQLPAGGDPELATTLDLVTGLERVTEVGAPLWRVGTDGPAPGWAGIVEAPVDADEQAVVTTVLDSDGTRVGADVGADVGAGGEERLLVLAESAGDGWRATLDGTRLPARDLDGRQAFTLGPDAGHVVVEYTATSRPPWFVLGGIILVVYVLLALPVGRRRSGR
ncbi:glycosyltransferase [Isoptericola jiangsuensis]|uniref:glycosyltransferase n=1 Tax=Isoptericola jiangsuensis TaxID=548579 RepID=UPI003AAEA54E